MRHFLLAVGTAAALGWAWAGGQAGSASRLVQYRCADGLRLAVTYLEGGKTARFTYRGRAYTLRTAASASGARYVGGNLQWWTKGNSAFLTTLKPAKTLHRDCLAR